MRASFSVRRTTVFFTLDFPSKLFYYSHSETERTISMPICTRDISEVEPLDITGEFDYEREGLACSAELTEDCRSSGASPSKPSALSRRLRMPRFGSRRGASASQHGFVLHIESPEERTMELLCSSKSEAQQWISALAFAIKMAQPDFSAPLTATALLPFSNNDRVVGELSDVSTEVDDDWQSDISCRGYSLPSLDKATEIDDDLHSDISCRGC